MEGFLKGLHTQPIKNLFSTQKTTRRKIGKKEKNTEFRLTFIFSSVLCLETKKITLKKNFFSAKDFFRDTLFRFDVSRLTELASERASTVKYSEEKEKDRGSVRTFFTNARAMDRKRRRYFGENDEFYKRWRF